MELGKLSVHHNICSHPLSVAITLLGVGNMEILKLNMETVTEGLTSTEEEVLKEVVDMFFTDIDKDIASWDGKQIEEYNLALKESNV